MFLCLSHSLLVLESTLCGSPNTAVFVSRLRILHLSAFLGKLSDIKSTWSSGPASHTQASLSHELWKVPRNTTAPTRPPPGLTNPKPSSTWGASPLGWTSSYSSGKLHAPRVPMGALPFRGCAYHFVLYLLCKDPCL